MSEFKKILLDLMKLNNISTFVELSACTGIPISTMSHWFNEDKIPSVSNLITLSKFFQVSIDKLLGVEDIKSEQAITEDKKIESELFYKFRKLSQNEKRLIIAYLDGLLA